MDDPSAPLPGRRRGPRCLPLVGAFVEHLEHYAASFDAPVVTGGACSSSPARTTGYRVQSDAGSWHARHVVIATGPHGRPRLLPGLDPARVLTAGAYRNPDALAPGGVLVVGASASGLQIADELARSGRDVTLAVGRHTRMPRRYRGMDAYWWLSVTGRLARTIDTMPDPAAARQEPSLQLVGTSGPPDRPRPRRPAAPRRPPRRAGRRVDGGTVELGDDLGRSVADAERRLRRLLGRSTTSHGAGAGTASSCRQNPCAALPSRHPPAASTWRPSGSRPSW